MLRVSIPQVLLAQYLVSLNRNLRNDTEFSSVTPMTRDQNPASESTSEADFSTAVSTFSHSPLATHPRG